MVLTPGAVSVHGLELLISLGTWAKLQHLQVLRGHAGAIGNYYSPLLREYCMKENAKAGKKIKRKK